MRWKIIINAVLLVGMMVLAPTIVSAADADSFTLQSTSKKNASQAKDLGKETDKPRGQLLYETHCTACHETSVHSRNPRKADSIGKVNYWVTRWSEELKLGWSRSDIGEVTSYVNSKYYNFAE